MSTQNKNVTEYLRGMNAAIAPHEDRVEELSTTYLAREPRVCLLDDDPMFGKLMEKIAAKEEIDISVCDSVDDLPAFDPSSVDVFIMDYDLGGITGAEVSEYLEAFMSDTPILMISFADRSVEMEGEAWPESIKEFIMKDEGGREILRRALEHIQYN